MVVDGSNLATEGRNTPSLAQLDEAVRSFSDERPGDEIIVVVDASFGYRIDDSERKVFEEAEEAGEIVSPPAGAIGRGDGFLLRIADRIGADVLSNDSFQEFHGEYLWLFEEGRLVGGKPVPGVGWIFTPRTPVRGPKSRVATRDADRARKRTSAASAAPVVRPEPTRAAIAEATAEAIDPEAPKTAKRVSRRRSGRSAAEPVTPEAINEPLPFITFIADHPLGTEVEGTVEGFTSHGAFVTAGGARCYAPVSGLGDPPPRSAKEVLTRDEVRTFVIQALAPPRRGIERALPGRAKVAGAPTDETVEAEIGAGAQPLPIEAEPDPAPAPAKPRRSRRSAAPEPVAVEPQPVPEPGETPAPARARRSRKAAAGAQPEVVVEPVVEAEVEPAPPARPRRSAVRKAAPEEPEAVEPVPAKRTRKKAATPAVEAPLAVDEPVRKAHSRKKAAHEPAAVGTPPVDEPVKKATRSRKKAAAPGVEPEATPVKKAPVKKAPVKKAAKASKAAKKQA